MKKKKGFTLVELLVVIAILAVLATVSVVGYMGFTKKAKESNDASLTAQMNTALQANGVVKKNKTLTEAREDLLEAGIDLEKVTPTTDGYSYVWDSKQDLMFLLNENRDVVAPTNATISANTVDSFVVIHNEAEFNTWKDFNYSLYFANGYESQTLTLTKLVGIDAGTSGINNISVKDDSSTADVTMYTTSGTLTIDARQAIVRHYGEVKTVSIKAIAGESYHEYGTVTGNVEVEDGHVVVENTANVSTIIAKPTESTTVKVTATNENNVGTIVTTDTSKTTFNVPESVKPTENITDDKLSEMNDFAGGLGTKKSPYLIENAEQFINIGKYSDQMKTGKSFSFKLISDIDLNKYDNDFSIFSENSIVAISGYFRGELNGQKDFNSNYKLIVNDDLDDIFVNSIGKTTISNIDYYLNNKIVWICAGHSGNTYTTYNNVDMYTIDKNTSIELTSNCGLYTRWIAEDVYNNGWASNNNVTIKNADVYVNIVSDGYSAVFFGGSPYYGGSGIVEDSTYYGNFLGSKVNLILGNLSHSNKYILIAKNVSNKGTLSATGGTPMIAGGNYAEKNAKEDPYGEFENVNLGINRVLNDASLGITYNADGFKLVEAESKSVEYYVLSIIGGTRYIPPYNENSSYTFDIRIEKSLFNNGIYQTNFKEGKLVTVEQYKEFVDSSLTLDNSSSIKVSSEENVEFWLVEHEGTMYYVFNFNDNNEKYFITKPNSVITSSPVKIHAAKITAYDEYNLPIAQKNVELNK